VTFNSVVECKETRNRKVWLWLSQTSMAEGCYRVLGLG